MDRCKKEPRVCLREIIASMKPTLDDFSKQVIDEPKLEIDDIAMAVRRLSNALTDSFASWLNGHSTTIKLSLLEKAKRLRAEVEKKGDDPQALALVRFLHDITAASISEADRPKEMCAGKVRYLGDSAGFGCDRCKFFSKTEVSSVQLHEVISEEARA
jgi:hypothetical protein